MDIFVFCINIQGGHKDSGRVRLDLRDLCEDFDWGNSSDCRNESRFSVPLRCIGEDVRCWMCSCQPCDCCWQVPLLGTILWTWVSWQQPFTFFLAVVWPSRNKRFLLTITVSKVTRIIPLKPCLWWVLIFGCTVGRTMPGSRPRNSMIPRCKEGKELLTKAHATWDETESVISEFIGMAGSCRGDAYSWLVCKFTLIISSECSNLICSNLLWMRSRPQRACQTLTENAWPSWVQTKDVMTFSLLVTDPLRLNARASCSL